MNTRGQGLGLGKVVANLPGRGVRYADPSDAADLELAVTAAGYRMCALDGAQLYTRARALPALASALRLPESAANNLDALADSLRDLPDWFPGEDKIVLFWRRAEQLVEGDPPLWDQVEEILSDTTEILAEDGIDFETIAFVEGYDIPLLHLRSGGAARSRAAGGRDGR